MDQSNGFRASMTRRHLLKVASLSVAGLTLPLLAACGPGPGPAPAPTQAPAQAPTKAPEPTRPAAPPATAAPAAQPTKPPAPPATTAPAPAATAVPAASPTPAAAAAKGGILNIQMEAMYADLFPVTATDRESGYVLSLINAALVEVSPQLEVVPNLAESVTPSPDAKEWTIKLRAAKWHDGKPVTANDVAFTIQLILTPDLASSYATPFRSIVGGADFADGKAKSIPGIQVVDDKTLKVTLAEANAGFMANLLYVQPVPKHVFGEMPVGQIKKSPEAQVRPIGCGPFKLVKAVADQYIEFARFDDFFRGPAKVDQVFLKIAKKDVALAMLERGEIDYMVDIAPLDVDRLKSVQGVTVHTIPNYSWPWFVWPNIVGKPYLQDKRVRQGLMHAGNRPGYTKSVLRGYANVIDSYFNMAKWAQAPDGATYPYDPKKAKELFDAAKWNYDQELDLVYYPGTKEREQWLPIFQQNLRDIGVKAKVRLIDSAVVGDVLKQGSFDMMMTGGGESPDPDTQFIYWSCEAMPPKATQNFAFCNDNLVDLFKKGRTTVNKDERAKLYRGVDKILREEVGWMLLAQKNYVDATGARLTGFVHNPNSGNRLFHVYEWGIK